MVSYEITERLPLEDLLHEAAQRGYEVGKEKYCIGYESKIPTAYRPTGMSAELTMQWQKAYAAGYVAARSLYTDNNKYKSQRHRRTNGGGKYKIIDDNLKPSVY